MTISFDPLRDVGRVDPYSTYRALRDEAPVHRVPETGMVVVSRFDDVAHVLRSHDEFSSRAMMTVLVPGSRDGSLPITPRVLWFAARLIWRARINPFLLPQRPSLIASDGARHDSLRAIVNRGFSPRRIAEWEARARAVVAECMASVDRSGRFELVHDLAVPLPVTVIAEMLGVEAERQRDFKRWSDAIIASATGAGRADPFNPQLMQAFYDLFAYLSDIARERRRKPADDLISAIVSREEGEAVTAQDAMLFVVLLLVAGNETTTNLIGNAVNALLDHPEQLARLAADPTLIPDAIEEAVRFDAPVQAVFRTATTDTEIAGTRIAKGTNVAALIGSANRDERRFPDADRFDVTRETQGHLGFGFGKHFCLGASLARLEARVALEALVPRLAALQKREAQPPRLDSFIVRGPQRLELVATPRAA